VNVDQAGKERFTRGLDDGRARRNLDTRPRASPLNPIAVDDNDGVVDRLRSRTVDQSGADDRVLRRLRRHDRVCRDRNENRASDQQRATQGM
jgi:hypothetical protein